MLQWISEFDVVSRSVGRISKVLSEPKYRLSSIFLCVDWPGISRPHHYKLLRSPALKAFLLSMQVSSALQTFLAPLPLCIPRIDHVPPCGARRSIQHRPELAALYRAHASSFRQIRGDLFPVLSLFVPPVKSIWRTTSATSRWQTTRSPTSSKAAPCSMT